MITGQVMLLCTSVHIPEPIEPIPQLLEPTKPTSQLLKAQKTAFCFPKKGKRLSSVFWLPNDLLEGLHPAVWLQIPRQHQDAIQQLSVFTNVAQFSKLLLDPSFLLSCPSDLSLKKPRLVPQGISES